MPTRASRLRVVGKNPPRVDAFQKAAGQSLFTDDIRVPHMLHGKVVRSTIPRGRITRIDTTRAARLAGVCAVETATSRG